VPAYRAAQAVIISDELDWVADVKQQTGRSDIIAPLDYRSAKADSDEARVQEGEFTSRSPRFGRYFSLSSPLLIITRFGLWPIHQLF
jgi:hypothetical protein